MLATIILLLYSLLISNSKASSLKAGQKLSEALLKWSYQAIRESKDNSIANKVENCPRYYPLNLIDESGLRLIVQTFQCMAHWPGIDNSRNSHCHHYEELHEKVIYRRDDHNKRIFFGYSFTLQEEEETADSYKYKLYLLKMADKIWNILRPICLEFGDYEQFHVGFESGGTLASLIGTRFALHSGTYLHFLNNVKVLSISEIPLFPVGYFPGVIGSANYLAFGRERELKELDPKVASLKSVNPIKVTKEDVSILSISIPTIRQVSFLPPGVIVENEAELQSILTSKLAQIYQQGSIIYNEWYSYIESINDQYLMETASFVEGRINSNLKLAEGYTVSCFASQQTAQNVEQNIFEIACNLQKESKKSFYMTGFLGRKCLLQEKGYNCASLSSPPTISTVWDKCFDELASQSPDLKFMTAYGAGKKCKFISIDNYKSGGFYWSFFPRGVVLVPFSSADAFAQINQENPRLFHSLIASSPVFPPICKGLISTIRKSKEEVAIHAIALQTTREYIAHKMEQPDILEQDQAGQNVEIPHLFTSVEMPSYLTTELFLSDYFPRTSHFALQFSSCMVEPIMINCLLKENQWISGACPSFCNKGVLLDQSIQFLCQNIISCPAINGHIAFTYTYLPIVRQSFAYFLKETELKGIDTLEYAIYTYRTNSIFGRTNDYFLGLFVSTGRQKGGIRAIHRPKKNSSIDLLSKSSIY